MRIKGLIFDMDGLIFDSEMIYYEGTQLVADEMGFPYDKDFYLKFLGISDEEVWTAYHQTYDARFGWDQVEEFIQRAYQKTLELFASGHGVLKPGVWELLRYLDEKKMPRVIASSNQRPVIDALLQNAQLSEEFATIVSFEDVTKAKPDPEIFEIAQQRIGLPKAELLVLEDSQNGVLAANGAGIPVVMIPDLLEPDESLREKTFAVLRSLEEMPEFLDKINS